MTTEPPSFVSFRTAPQRVGIYQLALDLSKQLYDIIELAHGVERFYLRDTLDKKSTAVPALISRALATAEMTERRELYRRARGATTDICAVLDILQHRGTVQDDAIENARVTALALLAQLVPLTVAPPMTR